MKTLSHLGLALALGASASATASGILRCVAPGGAVTYQQTPCAEASREELADIAADYPAPNLAERERLFEREAALYRRLEARRDREVQEVALRDAREERELERERLALAAALAAQPQYIAAYSYRGYGSRGTRAPFKRKSAIR